MFHVQLDACRPSLAPIVVKLETAVGQTIPDGGRDRLSCKWFPADT
jgi:hypothetical protein